MSYDAAAPSVSRSTRSRSRSCRKLLLVAVGVSVALWQRVTRLASSEGAGAIASVVMGDTEQVVLVLRERLSDRVVTSARVTRVEDLGDRVAVTYDDGAGQQRRVTALATVVATPAHVTRQMVADVPPELDQAQGTVRAGAFLSMAIFTDERGPLGTDYVSTVARH